MNSIKWQQYKPMCFISFRKREYVGKVVFACVEKVSSTGRSVVVGTEENVIASISLKTGCLFI